MVASAEAVPVHGITVLGHDFNGWAVAMICAVVAAFIYEATMTLTRKITRRIPFLLLKIACRSIREDLRDDVDDMWGAELTDILKNQGRGLLPGLCKGTCFALGLAAFGARRFMQTKAEAEVEAEVRMKEAEQDESAFEERVLAAMTPERRERLAGVVVRWIEALVLFVRHLKPAVIAVGMTAALVLAAGVVIVRSYDAEQLWPIGSTVLATMSMVLNTRMMVADGKSEK